MNPPQICPCGKTLPTPSGTSTTGGLCWTCYEEKTQREAREASAASVMANLDAWITGHLKRRGMSPRELKAVNARVPDRIRKAMPRDVVETLASGTVPTSGFGLGGNTDGGKTMAVAALLRHHVSAWARREIPQRGEVTPAWWLWCSWPDEVARFRANAVDPQTMARVDDLARIPLLILDDLGRERIKGTYADDWAASQLDAIVNTRYREERVTLWTTNVPEAELVKLYGAALVRRLTADNPLTWIPELRSAR